MQFPCIRAFCCLSHHITGFAIVLAKRGHTVNVYEKPDDLCGVFIAAAVPLIYMNNPLAGKMPAADSLGDEFVSYVMYNMTVTVKDDGTVCVA